MTGEKFTKAAIKLVEATFAVCKWGEEGGHLDVDKMRLTIGARKEKAKELVNGGLSLRQAAKVLGVNKRTIARDVGQNAPQSGAQSPRQEKDEEQYTLEHYQSSLIIHAGQAVDLATMFIASLEAMPLAITNEARKNTQQAAEVWTKLANQLMGEKNEN